MTYSVRRVRQGCSQDGLSCSRCLDRKKEVRRQQVPASGQAGQVHARYGGSGGEEALRPTLDMIEADLALTGARKARYEARMREAELELSMSERMDLEEERIKRTWLKEYLSEWRECGRPLKWKIDHTGVHPA